MPRTWILLAAALSLIGGGMGNAGPSSTAGRIGPVQDNKPARPVEKSVPPAPIAVPEGDGAPVITDGIFSPGEWDDAIRVPLNDLIELCLKQYRGVAFIGVHGLNKAMVGASDMFLAVPGGPIHQLHVSAQLGQALLPPSGAAPPFRFGLTTDWYANELRRDMRESERLEKEGRDPMAIILATSYPSDGIEFAIRLSRFPGPRWRMRLGISALGGGRRGYFIFPAATAERETEGWFELRFQ